MVSLYYLLQIHFSQFFVYYNRDSCAYLIKLYPVNITFSLQEEEAEWVGLSVREALRKARNEEAVSTPPPLKDILTKELIARLEGTSNKIIVKSLEIMEGLQSLNCCTYS